MLAENLAALAVQLVSKIKSAQAVYQFPLIRTSIDNKKYKARHRTWLMANLFLSIIEFAYPRSDVSKPEINAVQKKTHR